NSWEILQAPRCQRQWRNLGQAFLAAGYADILCLRGFGAVEDLLPLVRGWDRLIEQVQPELVVCDHSPTLVLSAYRRLPTVLVGNGFTLPPADQSTFPLLLPGRALLQSEDQLLGVVQEVQRIRGQPAPGGLPGLFAAAERFVTVFPELDPYQGSRRE